MRGKEDLCAKKLIEFRITPAYAGKRKPSKFRFGKPEDHPRLCGEKNGINAKLQLVQGSPPPMRGKETAANASLHCLRITPAYAGKSRQSLHIEKNIWDHPRLCGEKKVIRQCCYHGGGSPPPMRGKVSFTLAADIGRRITPAYAGKSFLHPRRRHRQKDHPRLCGEKFPSPSPPT